MRHAVFFCLQQINEDSETTSRPCDGVTSVGDVIDDAKMTTIMTFMAVKHYDPRYFSQSGRIEQELALTEGDTVRLRGILALAIYTVFQKSDAKIQITITTAHLIRIKYTLSSLNYHLSGANIASFHKIHRTDFEQQLFKKWNSKTEVSNMEKSPYQFLHNTISYSLCSKWSPFAQTPACLLCRPYVLCCCRTSCLQTL